jgi:hypothetical protein
MGRPIKPAARPGDPPMIWRLLADLVITLHLAFIAFAVLGGFLAWRWRPVVFAQLPALAWGAWIELSGHICPLTPIENLLRHKAGDAGYHGNVIDDYIVPLIYPIGLTQSVQYWLAGFLVVINLIAYGGLLLIIRRQPRDRRPPQHASVDKA